MSSEVAQKRPRDGDESTSSNHTIPLAGLTRDKHFWFEDGNLVLVGQDTGFKVYKGLLAAQSPVFEDLFGSACHAEEVFDGCPVVRLSDSPDDLRALLPFLLPTTYVGIPTDVNMDSADEYKQLSAMLRLADKYQIESIAHQATDCLKLAFTDDFDRWDARPEAYGLRVREDSEPSTTHRLRRAIDAVHLARITGTPSVLPLALYHCALLGDGVDDGWTAREGDGTVRRLDAADLERCEGGYRYFCEKREGFLDSLFEAAPSAECRTRIMCSGFLEVLKEKGAAVYETPALLNRPDGWTVRIPLCRPCARELGGREKVARRELWMKLPEIFKLSEEVKVWEA